MKKRISLYLGILLVFVSCTSITGQQRKAMEEQNLRLLNAKLNVVQNAKNDGGGKLAVYVKNCENGQVLYEKK